MKKILPLIFVISLVLLDFGYAQECNLESDADTIVVGTISSVLETPEYFKPGIPISNVFVLEVIKGSKDLDRKYVTILLNSSEELSEFKGHEGDTVKVYLKLSFYDPTYGDLYELVCGSQGKETVRTAGMPDIPAEFYDEWQEFSKKYYSEGDTYKTIQWDYSRNIPIFIGLGMYEPKSGGSFEKQAEEFISENKALLGIEIGSLKLAGTKDTKNTAIVGFNQVYKGISVYGAYVKLIFYQGDGRIASIASNYYPNMNIPIKPLISEKKAIDTAIKESGLDEPKTRTNAELVIYPLKLRLAYVVDVASTEGIFNKLYFVDAQNGEILGTKNMVVSSFESSPISQKDDVGKIVKEYANELYIVGFVVILVLAILLFIIYKKRKIKNQDGSGS